jgi:hypothetical protein
MAVAVMSKRVLLVNPKSSWPIADGVRRCKAVTDPIIVMNEEDCGLKEEKVQKAASSFCRLQRGWRVSNAGVPWLLIQGHRSS